MRPVVRSQVDVAAPAQVVWDYVTDWPRQAEWIPFTRVEAVDGARGVGGRIRGWTGLGPVGFWDDMTITAWDEPGSGRARCEMLHTGRLVRGEAGFEVDGRGPGACTFTWWEHLVIPGGPVGAVLWRLSGWAMQRGLDVALRRMAGRVESRRTT